MIPSIYKTFKPATYEFLGGVVKAPAPYLILCAKRGIGLILPAALMRPRKAEHVRWMTPENVMNLARIDRTELARRIRDGWSGWDLLKPHGWQRCVDARRSGITWNGETLEASQWARRLGLTPSGFVRRLADHNQGMDEVMQPARKRERIFTERAPTGVTGEPIISASGGIRGHFFYKGAIDTLAGHCRAAGMSLDTVRYRLRRKDKHGNMMSLEQALSTPTGGLRRSDRGVKNRKRGLRNDPLANLEVYPDVMPATAYLPHHPATKAAIAKADADFEASGGQAALDAVLGPISNDPAPLAKPRPAPVQFASLDDLMPLKD